SIAPCPPLFARPLARSHRPGTPQLDALGRRVGKARKRRAVNARCISIAPCPRVRRGKRSAMRDRDADRVGTARIAGIILLIGLVLRAFAHPTERAIAPR